MKDNYFVGNKLTMRMSHMDGVVNRSTSALTAVEHHSRSQALKRETDREQDFQRFRSLRVLLGEEALD